MGWDALGISVQLAVSVLDELVKAMLGIIVLIHFKIVVEGLVNGFDTWLDSMTDDISYSLPPPDRTEKKETTTLIPLRH